MGRISLPHWISAALLSGLTCSAHAAAPCKIIQLAELHLSRAANRPVIDGQINGQPIKILFDTGSVRSYITGGAARRLKLPLRQNSDQRVYGVGGEVAVLNTVVEQLKIGNYNANGLRLSVLESKLGQQSDDIAFLLGADFFANFTAEYDLGHGAVRLLRAEGCQPEQLVYWDKAYSLTKLEHLSVGDPHFQTEVLVNGKTASAWLDTGASISNISRQAAQNAGVTPGDRDTQAASAIHGLAQTAVASWVGRFDTFTIGNETIRNAKLRIADMFANDRAMETGSNMAHAVQGLPDMLIGDDFFLSHRLVILPREHLLLFTYTGGPVFQVNRPDEAPEAAAP
jgi:predicted aspartyl protease